MCPSLSWSSSLSFLLIFCLLIAVRFVFSVLHNSLVKYLVSRTYLDASNLKNPYHYNDLWPYPLHSGTHYTECKQSTQ